MNKDIYGLTEIEAEEKKKKGLVNVDTEDSLRSVSSIVRSNVFTLFNGINIVLAILVIIAGSPKNILFAGVILTNTLTGIFQELKARQTLKSLSIMNKHPVKVLRDGEKVTVSPEDIVQDDVVVLETGVQVPVDGAILCNNTVEVDNSALTGESEPDMKSIGDFLYSGSIILSGYCLLRAEKVGDDRYMSKLSAEAREFKISNSELKESIDKIIRFLVNIILPLGLMLIISQMFFAGKPWRVALLSTVAGIISMIPEGLVLLTTLSFLMGVVRLAKWNTLVQELPATEVLARIDTLCLDKTGTITKGKLHISEIEYLDAFESESEKCIVRNSLLNGTKDENITIETIVENAIQIVAKGFDVVNPTQQAIIEYSEKYANGFNSEKLISDIIPFNSERKWSSVLLNDGSAVFTGAVEILCKNKYCEFQTLSESYSNLGKRVLVIAYSDDFDKENKDTSNIIPLSLLIFEDEIRESANATLKYFRSQGVDIKIISGDNPLTVANISKKAGVENADKYVDASTLPNSKEAIREALLENAVFGRVTPEQKRDIVEALQDMGKAVAMTGDGINDVLALKKSDCAIALANGTDAAKAVSHLVLLDEDFSNLTYVVDEGRRIINNLERTAGLYLSKTIYSILLSLFFAVTALPYPFIPIQLTLIGGLTIGIPSFFLAIENNNEKVNKGFLKRVLIATVPKGATVALFSVLCFVVGYKMKIDIGVVRTFTTLVVGSIGMLILAMLSSPLTRMRFTLLLTMSLAFIASFVFPIGRKIFSFHEISPIYFLLAAGMVVLSYFTIKLFEKLAMKYGEFILSRRRFFRNRK